MKECRNAKLGDPDSTSRVTSCAAFSLGALLGGRRPHSLITIKSSDVQLLSEEDAGQRLHKLPASSCLEVEVL